MYQEVSLPGERQKLHSVTSWNAKISSEAPRVSWNHFLDHIMKWKQGEHVGLIAPTGQGKTTLVSHLLPEQPFVVAFATKPVDRTMEKLVETGYARTMKWDHTTSATKVPRRVLWPDATKLHSKDHQIKIFGDAFEHIYIDGGWCVFLDEGWYMNNMLKLKEEIQTYLLQSRSLGITLVFASQRPAWIPLEVYDQSTHLFFGRDNDRRNLDRISGISFLSGDLVRHIVARLEQYQFLHINTRTGTMVRTRAPGPVAKGGDK